MINFIVYSELGQILRFGSCPDELFSMQARDGESILEGVGAENLYVVEGELTELPEKPGDFYDFNYSTKQWELNAGRAAVIAIAIRDQLLKDGPDRISPLWWSSMTPEQQQAWTTYRQDLLDITQQPGYPNAIIWPIKP